MSYILFLLYTWARFLPCIEAFLLSNEQHAIFFQWRAHGQTTLQVRQRGGGHSFKCSAFNHERVPVMFQQLDALKAKKQKNKKKNNNM